MEIFLPSVRCYSKPESLHVLHERDVLAFCMILSLAQEPSLRALELFHPLQGLTMSRRTNNYRIWENFDPLYRSHPNLET